MTLRALAAGGVASTHELFIISSRWWTTRFITWVDGDPPVRHAGFLCEDHSRRRASLARRGVSIMRHRYAVPSRRALAASRSWGSGGACCERGRASRKHIRLRFGALAVPTLPAAPEAGGAEAGEVEIKLRALLRAGRVSHGRKRILIPGRPRQTGLSIARRRATLGRARGSAAAQARLG